MSARPELGATRPSGDTHRRPVLKSPVWKPEVPTYFYIGGLAGASAGLGLLSDLRGEHAVARRAWAVALAGSVASPVLLISDLGVPRRFLHMLRLFKVTSPMSVGSWVLAGFGTATAPAAANVLSGGRLGAPGRVAEVAAAMLGLPLASYTGALLATTAVPVWHAARLELPFLFVAGATASAGAAATALSPVREAQAARRLAVGGAIMEIVVDRVMHHRLQTAGLATAYREGTPKQLGHVATALTAGGAALIALRGRRSRAAAVAGGLALSAGALAERWTVFHAGSASAARAQDTVAPQRAHVTSGDRRGAARAGRRAAAA
jgi:formate-dependent nitrite reductase membrane component NrfD